MSTSTESRPSWTARPSRPSGASGSGAASIARKPSRPEIARDAIPSPPPSGASARPSTISANQSQELVDQLQSVVDRLKTAEDCSQDEAKETMIDNVKRIAKAMQKTVAKLGGIASPCGRDAQDGEDDGMRTSRTSLSDGRPSLSSSLDGYRPDRDVVAPISVRPNAMELLWVCGDCGAHYPRQRQPPENCEHCGAPKQNFYAPIED